MLILVTGEGPTDIGSAESNQLCAPDTWVLGPITLFIEKFVQKHIDPTITIQQIWFAPKKYISNICKELRPMAIPSHGCKETEGRKRTRALMAAALDLSHKQNEDVLPILFRDTDSKSNALRRHQEIRKSIKNISCFTDNDNFFHVCPIVPCPTSEAWLLCALKENYNQNNCRNLETTLSGNSDSPFYAKAILEGIIGEYSASMLCELIVSGEIDPLRISMSSLENFLMDLKMVTYKRSSIQISPTTKQKLCRALPS